MSLLNHLKIKTKILAIVVALSLVSIGGALELGIQFDNVGKVYSRFIANDATSASWSTRATANIYRLGYSAKVMAVNEPDSPRFKAELATYEKQLGQAYERLTESARLVPSRTEAMNSAIAGVKDIDKAIRVMIATKDRATALQLSNAIDDQISKFAPVITKNNADVLESLVTGRQTLEAKTANTIFYSILLQAIVSVIIVALTLYVVSKGITGPILSLRQRMTSLADGENQTEVPGLDRRDEVGEMARAVSIFRENALDRLRLERDANHTRLLSEEERALREAQKLQDAEATSFAVGNLADALSRLAEGDMTHRIEARFRDELDGLRQNFNRAVETLQSTLSAVGQNANAIESGANEMRSAADDLARRTEQQAASVEETAAALEEITTTVKNSTQQAEQVGQLVAKARSGAERSGHVVANTVAAMEAIKSSSEQITNIISVIDEIAFQTNLLALNAGVEAARAGEAGKGFAVVAQEVRELAQRSAQAAKEIRGLIRTSSDQVLAGVMHVNETGEALQMIASEVKSISKLVDAIVEGAREQSSGLQEISTAVHTMDQGTQQNAAMVEQSTAATHGLVREVSALNELIGQFKLGHQSLARVAQNARDMRSRVA
ncbi:methyl-accepting chemotaxis protein [Rhizobium sp.]|jgi:methyl-accepting chemotaxis protein|uniref:methyl-accepting chemotaxis protein n=1 Tax=Rhizobium sp. TaxID=391 RepID=UPI000E82F9D3|nr:methyl-accepting chemotaxis protein [Rhizobium sp.]